MGSTDEKFKNIYEKYIVTTPKNSYYLFLIPFMLVIMVIYFWWLTNNSFENATTIWFLVILIGCIYALAIYFIRSGGDIKWAIVALGANLLFMIAIMSMTKLERKEGKQDHDSFKCFGITPFFSGFYLLMIAVWLWYPTQCMALDQFKTEYNKLPSPLAIPKPSPI